MATGRSSPYMAYGQIAAIIAAVVAAVGNVDLRTDPHARPDPFTGTQGRALEARVRGCEEWRNDHVQWGRQRAGQNDARFEELYRRMQDAESKIYDLYTRHHND